MLRCYRVGLLAVIIMVVTARRPTSVSLSPTSDQNIEPYFRNLMVARCAPTLSPLTFRRASLLTRLCLIDFDFSAHQFGTIQRFYSCSFFRHSFHFDKSKSTRLPRFLVSGQINAFDCTVCRKDLIQFISCDFIR